MSAYPEWFQEYLDAPTEDLPGFFGDWLDADLRAEEDDNSLVLSWSPNEDGHYVPEIRFYGAQSRRRTQAAIWLYADVIARRLMKAAETHADVREGLDFAELPLRLTFSPEYADRVFGRTWDVTSEETPK